MLVFEVSCFLFMVYGFLAEVLVYLAASVTEGKRAWKGVESNVIFHVTRLTWWYLQIEQQTFR